MKVHYQLLLAYSLAKEIGSQREIYKKNFKWQKHLRKLKPGILVQDQLQVSEVFTILRIFLVSVYIIYYILSPMFKRLMMSINFKAICFLSILANRMGNGKSFALQASRLISKFPHSQYYLSGDKPFPINMKSLMVSLKVTLAQTVYNFVKCYTHTKKILD